MNKLRIKLLQYEFRSLSNNNYLVLQKINAKLTCTPYSYFLLISGNPRPPAFDKYIWLATDSFWELIGLKEIWPLFTPYLKLLVGGNSIASKIVTFGQKRIGFNTFWEFIGQNETWTLFDPLLIFEITGRRKLDSLLFLTTRTS